MSETKRKLIFDLIFIAFVYRCWNLYAWIFRAILYPKTFDEESMQPIGNIFKIEKELQPILYIKKIVDSHLNCLRTN